MGAVGGRLRFQARGGSAVTEGRAAELVLRGHSVGHRALRSVCSSCQASYGVAVPCRQQGPASFSPQVPHLLPHVV